MALSDSILQSELVMSEVNFLELFPDQEGFQRLLADVPPGAAARVAQAIEDGARDLGAHVTTTAEQLAGFHRVENTYISTFQALGGLGLLVGTIGLAAVLLRNVLERRKELALLGAVGYRRAHLFAIVLAENVLLLIWGLAIGAACAAVAVVPAVVDRGGWLPIGSGGWALLAASSPRVWYRPRDVCGASHAALSALRATRAGGENGDTSQNLCEANE